MLKDKWVKLALNYVSIPEDYHLRIEDYNHHQAKLVWSKDDFDQNIEVTFDHSGKLLELTRPPSTDGTPVTTEEQRVIAEQFLSSQYPEALHYLTLSTVDPNEVGTKFIYKQYAGGYPLASYTTKITVSKCGEVIEFMYGGYTNHPPAFPATLADQEAILQQAVQAPWRLSIKFLSRDIYSVPTSGLYPVYESPILSQSFHAESGKPIFEPEMEETKPCVPFPNVPVSERRATIEEIIGVPDSMIKIREVEIEEDTIGIVWRDKDWQSPEDKTMESFIRERMEDTVKAKVDKQTGKLKEFIWFKERTGELDLSFEACRDIACTFIATYFADYVPYVQLQLEEPSFNEANRAFFTFPVYVAPNTPIDGEQFYVGVNRTTGFIDLLYSPHIDLKLLESFEMSSIKPFEDVILALKEEIDAVLQWSKNYGNDGNTEVLVYKLRHKESKRPMIGIDATSGKMIVSKV